MDNAELRDLSQREPWRSGQGWMVNALDPIWPGFDPAPCPGQVTWSADGRWWWCECGYCSSWPSIIHPPAKHPAYAFLRNVAHYLSRRTDLGQSPQQAMLQLLHAAGMLAKTMAEQTPEQLLSFIEQFRTQ
jgi:hypothetical protein